MGRNRIPDQMKVARGTDQPCRMSKSGQLPDAHPVKLTAPKMFSKEEKKLFAQCSAILSNWRLLNEADAGVITMYVRSLSRWMTAEQKLDEEGMIINVKDENGDVVGRQTNAWYDVSQKERKMALALEQQLGFSPVSRAKILSMIKPEEQDKDEFSEFD